MLEGEVQARLQGEQDVMGIFVGWLVAWLEP